MWMWLMAPSYGPMESDNLCEAVAEGRDKPILAFWPYQPPFPRQPLIIEYLAGRGLHAAKKKSCLLLWLNWLLF